MYIKKLESWTSLEWNKFFTQFPLLLEEEKEEVKYILKQDKRYIESSFEKLWDMGVINGIGAFWFPVSLRATITWICPYFRWEWHDLMWAIWGTEEERKKSDVGMLKYSFISISSDIIISIESGNIIKILHKCLFSNIIRTTITVIFYILVRIFGRFGSFRYY